MIESTPTDVVPQFPLSPLPLSHRPPVQMTFDQAVAQMLETRKVTRLEWDTNEIYCAMRDELLMIFINGELHPWTISRGDLEAQDWIVLPE